MIEKDEMLSQHCSALTNTRNSLMVDLYKSLSKVLYNSYVDIVNERIDRCFTLSQAEWEKLKNKFLTNKYYIEFDIIGDKVIFNKLDDDSIEIRHWISSDYLFEGLPKWFTDYYSASEELAYEIQTRELSNPEGTSTIKTLSELSINYKKEKQELSRIQKSQKKVEAPQINNVKMQKTPKQLYEDGLRFEKGGNIKKAVRCYTEAAEQGNANAQNDLGDCYYYGEGVKQNYAEAVKWYRKAAEQGNANAQYNLGECYWNGDGIKQNKALAFSFYEKSAKQGNDLANNRLGLIYEDGEYKKADIRKAIKYYQAAADAGYHVAMYNLGVNLSLSTT